MNIMIFNDAAVIQEPLLRLISRSTNGSDKIVSVSDFKNILMEVLHGKPDVVIINTYAIRSTIQETIRAIKTICDNAKIISLTEFHDELFQKHLKNSGTDFMIDIAHNLEQIPTILTDLKNKSANSIRC
jgi:DNA-binding NarL/FixJ family response regulator